MSVEVIYEGRCQRLDRQRCYMLALRELQSRPDDLASTAVSIAHRNGVGMTDLGRFIDSLNSAIKDHKVEVLHQGRPSE